MERFTFLIDTNKYTELLTKRNNFHDSSLL